MGGQASGWVENGLFVQGLASNGPSPKQFPCNKIKNTFITSVQSCITNINGHHNMPLTILQ